MPELANYTADSAEGPKQCVHLDGWKEEGSRYDVESDTEALEIPRLVAAAIREVGAIVDEAQQEQIKKIETIRRKKGYRGSVVFTGVLTV